MLLPWLLAVVTVSAASLSDVRPFRYYSTPSVAAQWPSAVIQPPHVKKYDRNCFFSPVQCMMMNYPTSDPIIIGYKYAAQ